MRGAAGQEAGIADDARMSTELTGKIAAALVVLSAIGGASEARAGDVLRPSTKPLYFTTALGPAIGFAACNTTGDCASGDPQTVALWWNEFGYHFSGKGDGPLIAGYFHLGGKKDVIRFGVGAKFGWDIPIYNKAIFIQPNTTLGYGLTSANSPFVADQHYAAWTLGAQVNFRLNNVGVIYVQPITFEVNGNGDGVILGWDLLFGGGVQF